MIKKYRRTHTRYDFDYDPRWCEGYTFKGYQEGQFIFEKDGENEYVHLVQYCEEVNN